jgi:hypothetical protein
LIAEVFFEYVQRTGNRKSGDKEEKGDKGDKGENRK